MVGKSGKYLKVDWDILFEFPHHFKLTGFKHVVYDIWRYQKQPLDGDKTGFSGVESDKRQQKGWVLMVVHQQNSMFFLWRQ